MPLVVWSLLLHAWVGWRLLPALGAWPAWIAVGALLLVSALTLPRGLSRVHGPGREAALQWIGLISMGWFSSLFVLTLLRDLAILALAGVGWAGWAGPDPAAFHLHTAWAVLAGATLATGWGYANARRTPALRRVDVPIAGLPGAFAGYTIAQISDLHVGPTIRERHVRAVVERINGAAVDAVAITGDLIDAPASVRGGEVAPLGELRSRDGTWFVTGNHEYYQGGVPGAMAWVRTLEALGIRTLLNAHALVTRDGARLLLAGVTDHGAARFDRAHASDPARALAGAPADATPRILLAHQPRSAAAAAAAGFDLQLSGHTHGGQFWPWNLFVPLQQPFVAGLHRLGRLWVYVSRGTGYWGPPKRFGAPSEITLLRLVPAGPAAG